MGGPSLGAGYSVGACRNAALKDIEKIVDFKRIISGREPDYALEPNDVVVVKESFF